MAQYMDWMFTEDGDLDLGAPKMDENGAILYKHYDGTIDTEPGEDGKEIRDLAYSRGFETEKQIIINRLKTDAPDWFHHPLMGGNLSDLIGEPNTRETGELGANLILAALTYRGLYNSGQLSVRPIPISAQEIMFMVTISRNYDTAIRVPIVFDLEHGVLSEYIPGEV